MRAAGAGHTAEIAERLLQRPHILARTGTIHLFIAGYRDDGAAPTLIKIGDRTVFRHAVSNFRDLLAVLRPHDWPIALGGHFHTRESIRYESAVRTRFHQAAAVVGPTGNVVPRSPA